MIRFAKTNRSGSQLARKLMILCITFSLISIAVLAQQAAAPTAAKTAKRPLAHTDYDTWQTITMQQLTRDAKFLGYVLNAQDADGQVVVRNLASSQEYRHNRGYRAETPPAATPDGEEYGPDQGRGAGARGGGGAGSAGLTFTSDGKFALFQILPTKKENEDARKANTRPADMPQNAMGIMDLSTGKVERIERVRRFAVPEEGNYVVYLIEPKPEPAPAGRGTEGGVAAATPPAGGAGRQGAAAGGRQGAGGTAGARGGGRGGSRTEYGVEMIVSNLADKSQRSFADVLDIQLTRDGKNMVYTVSARKPESNGIYLIPFGSAGESKALLAGRGRYTRITWNEKQTQMLFSSDKDDATAAQPKAKIYLVDMANPSATELLSASMPNFKQGYVISDRGGLSFSQDSTRVFFSIAKPGEAPEQPAEGEAAPATPAPAASATTDPDKVNADLWHWKDDFIQPMQKVRGNQDANRSYSVVYNVGSKKLTQLSDDTLPQVTPQADGRWALGSDDRPYRIMVGYEQGNMSDYYLVNTDDGSRKKLLTKATGGISFSTTARYGMRFDGKDWISISIPDGKETNLTKDLGVNFYNENHDTPSTPGSFGNAGWTKDDSFVLLNDRYDIWKVAPNGSGAKNLTEGLGRKEKIIFRYVNMRTEPGERGIDPAQPMLLSAVNEWTRDTGFYRTKFEGGTPQKLLMGPKNYGTPTKARNADVYMLTASTFNEFPDILTCGLSFENMKKVTNANPQRANILWGTSELIRFKSTDGVQLSATLYKPENFDPKKKYPMLVYIYELLSQGVNNFVNPAPGTSINKAYYVSNGYLVLEPDIVYNIGYPGPSAMKCVLPAIQAVADKGFLDEKAIGIQGHSWGGYQIAYMITQTNRFAAAAAGAPVSNMTSAYSGIRWGTGLPRQFQYEHTQSRIGGNLWESTMLYIQNSPVFQANRVQTPLMMLHNDQDDAVPWYQGIEYYLALRRLNKEVYLWVYNGEPHGLRRRPNMKDYTVRMQQFFDHKLKGAPMPEWMEKGIPFSERDKEKERLKEAVYGVKK
jgi:dipeptidyl aminopeptidase/acylaminoacyl peptidase